MAQATSATAQEDFFMGDWPATWTADQPIGSFDVQTGTGILPEPAPAVNTTHDLVTSGDIRSLLIMICSRLDKIESTVGKLDSASARTRDSLEQNALLGNQLKEVIDSLRKSMGAFSKALFNYLRGEEGPNGKAAGAG